MRLLGDRQVIPPFLVVILLASALLPATAGLGAADTQPPSVAPSTAANGDTVTLEGAAIPMGATTEQQYLRIMGKLVESDDYDVESRNHVFRVRTPDGISVVYADADVAPAEVTVTGTQYDVSTESGTDVTVVFASSVDATTSAEALEFNELYENTSDYEYEVVEVTGNYRQLTYQSSLHRVPTKERRAVLTQMEQTQYFGTMTGRHSRWATINLTANGVGDTPEKEAFDKLIDYGSLARIEQQREAAFWMDGEMTIQALVLPPENGAVRLYLVDVAPDARHVDDVGELRRGLEHQDEIVTFRSQVVGERVDAHSRLEKSTGCSQDWYIRVNSDVGCAPSVTTVATHSGTVFEQGASETEMVKYTGISNHDLSQETAAERGEYQITGRVIPGEYLDPRYADQNVILVYEMERIRGLAADQETVETAESIADQVSDTVTEQLEASNDEWEEKEDELAPADLSIENASLDDEYVLLGNSTTASVTVMNDGNTTGALTISLTADGTQLQETDVRLAAGETTTIEFPIRPSETGTIRLQANDYLVGDLAVYETSEDAAPEENSTTDNESEDGDQDSSDSEDTETRGDTSSQGNENGDGTTDDENSRTSSSGGDSSTPSERTSESDEGGILPGSGTEGEFTGGAVFFVIGAVVLVGGPLGVLGIVYFYNQ